MRYWARSPVPSTPTRILSFAPRTAEALLNDSLPRSAAPAAAADPRRKFLRGSAAAAGAALLGSESLRSASAVLGANDKIRVGVLGTGERAQYLMTLFKKVPLTEIVAVCDVFQPHLDAGLKIAGPDAKPSLDYREVLDRKDVDAVIIGSPDHWHKTMLVDAVRAGKDVYCEKPIMHSIEEGIEMVRAVEESR